MREDNKLLQRCNGDCAQGRNCECYEDEIEGTWVFWALLFLCLGFALGMPFLLF